MFFDCCAGPNYRRFNVSVGFEQKLVSLAAYLGQSVYVAFVRQNIQPTVSLMGDRWVFDNINITGNTLKTDDFDANDVGIYPNSATESIYIQTRYLTFESIKIYNNVGQLVLSLVESSPISFSKLPSGTYFIKLHSKSGSITKKFIKI